jgi:selenocysteine lyase/cysteine desulfurase
MLVDRRQVIGSMAAMAAARTLRPFFTHALDERRPTAADAPLHDASGRVDWKAVRALFPLREDWTHFASFLFVSHPKPVARAIDELRRKIDADPFWVEIAALPELDGKPYAAVKRALADYTGGAPSEICLTSNTTGALAMAWHGLRIRPDQEILTTEHDHFVHHESIRLAAERSGARVRKVALFDTPAKADADEMVARIARAIRPSTRAVGVTWVQSSTGVRLPIARIADAVGRANTGRSDADRCLLVVDGVHGFANQDIDVARLGADFFAAGTHKWLFAPRGTGFLWGRTDAWEHLRLTIPTFDPDGMGPWKSWMDGVPQEPTTAAAVAPGGFVAYEHLLAVPAAVELHGTIGRTAIAARIAELNAQFREGASRIPGITLHTPRDGALAGPISCFEVAGHDAVDVTKRLAEHRVRTAPSPYKVSYPRVSAGSMNTPAEVDAVLRLLREMPSRA